MGEHIVNGQFQSDKYPTCPPGKVPLSVKDGMAQDLLWEYAQRRQAIDRGFSDDLQTALQDAGFRPVAVLPTAQSLRAFPTLAAELKQLEDMNARLKAALLDAAFTVEQAVETIAATPPPTRFAGSTIEHDGARALTARWRALAEEGT